MTPKQHPCKHCGNHWTVIHYKDNKMCLWCSQCQKDTFPEDEVIFCPLCGNDQSVDKAASNIVGVNNNLYYCVWCDEEFEWGKDKPITCPNCLVIGQVSVLDLYEFLCTSCHKRFHTKKIKDSKMSVSCPKCTVGVLRQGEYIGQAAYYCSKCYTEFANISEIMDYKPSKPMLYVYQGLPGSGKTTAARLRMNNEPLRYVRVNKDEIREELKKDGWVWSHENEAKVIAIRDRMIIDAIKGGKDVISDDTNLSHRHIKRFEELRKELDCKFTIERLEVPIDTCVERDAQRPEKERVGEKVIRDMAQKYGFTMKVVEDAPKPEQRDEFFKKAEFTGNKMPAIICDLDGTLALHNGRDPHDLGRVKEDLVNRPILKILHTFYKHDQYQIIYVSGREDRARMDTGEWLIRVGAPLGKLLMRKNRDFRKDWIVKGEIFNEEIRHKYDVLFVLDDRNQVVDFWRKIGLTCLQVAEGNF